MRRFVFGAALVLTLIASAPASAASASSWRATIGGTIHGGSTTLIDSNGHGSLSVKVGGVTAGVQAIAEIVPASCGAAAHAIVAFRLPAATPTGAAAGSTALGATQVKAFNAAVSAHTGLSIHVIDGAARGCGNLAGAPGLGTARLTGSVDPVGATYDIRYPVVTGIDAVVATAINARLSREARDTVAIFSRDAIEAGTPMPGWGPSTGSQTFSVSLSRSNLLSMGELYSEFWTGAAHGLDTLSTNTFDLTTGREIQLADLFRPGTPWLQMLSTESRKRLHPVAGLESSYRDGTAPKTGNFSSWQLTTGGLKITFGEYQVGPFAIGMPVVVIPWATLRPIMDLNGPVARLLPRG